MKAAYQFIFALACMLLSQQLTYAVPVTLYQSYAGNINFLSSVNTFRTSSDAITPCAVSVGATTIDLSQSVVDPAAPAVTGLPVGATILAAHLYWVGSYSIAVGSTLTTPDYNVILDGVPITADRTFTDTFLYFGINYDFFSGYKDITAEVIAKGNGIYSLSGLSTNTGAPHCTVGGVVAGWSIQVIYSIPSEPMRVINLFDGFQHFRASQIILNPNNFQVPDPAVAPFTPINGKLGQLTWEGDVGNSQTLVFTENFSINTFPLTDAINPLNNQFNSTRNSTNPSSSITYGADMDVFDISAYLTAGDTSAMTQYASGGDLVLLSAEIFSTTNTPVADLAIAKTHGADFNLGEPSAYTINVTNHGPSIFTGTTTVTDTLPSGLTFNSATGTGWTCSFVAPTLTCTNPTTIAVATALPPITLAVTPTFSAVPSVTNTATVSGTMFDNIAANNSSSDLTVVQQPALTVLKSASGTGGPGSVLTYSIQVFNTGPTLITNVINTDVLSNYTSFGVDCYGPAISITFTDAGSGLSMGTPAFSSTGAAPFSHIPIPGGTMPACPAPGGFDSAIKAFQVPMTGTMNPASNYTLQYKVKIK